MKKVKQATNTVSVFRKIPWILWQETVKTTARRLDYDSSDPVQVHPSFKGHDAKVLPDHNELNHPGDYLAVK